MVVLGIAGLFLLPTIVFGGAMLLLAQALLGGWLWGVLVCVVVALGYGAFVAWFVWWAKRHPDRAGALGPAVFRAIAFGSGGFERRPGSGPPRP
jgi:O-antigen/teichoic acid export membrane protein